MAEYDKIPEKTLKKWVRDSIELDLKYDEEQEPPEGFKDLHNEPEPLPERGTDLTNWYKHFEIMKKSRVYYDLTFDKVRNKFSNPRSNTEYKEVEDAARKREEILDNIMWNCAAAISTLRTLDFKQQPVDKKARDTLIALFHSELCASSPQDVAWSQANSFNSVLKDKNSVVGYKIFQWIADHNIARGYNHLQLYLKAAGRIDFLVDGDIGLGQRRAVGVEQEEFVYRGDAPQVLAEIAPPLAVPVVHRQRGMR